MGRAARPDLAELRRKSAWQREGQSALRLEMGREKFLEQCWNGKSRNGGTHSAGKWSAGYIGGIGPATGFTMDTALHAALGAGSIRSAL